MHKKARASSWSEVIGTLALVVCIVGPRAHGGDPGDCTYVLEEQVVQQLDLRSARSVRPGISTGFTLGTWECCSFLVPVRDACVSYEVLPPEAATVEAFADVDEFGPSGLLHIGEDVVHGTIITLRAVVEDGRRTLETTLHVYTPEANPLVGYWRESERLPCIDFVRADQDQNGEIELSDAVTHFTEEAGEPACGHRFQ